MEVCYVDAVDGQPFGRLARAVRHAAAAAIPGRPVVLVDGTFADQRRWLRTLVTGGLRPGVRVVVRAPIARVPLHPWHADLFALADLVVTESAFGARAVRECCRAAGAVRASVAVVPPMVPATSAGGTGPEPPIAIACALEDKAAAFRALQIFHVFADGLYWECCACRRVTPYAVDRGTRPVTACGPCGSTLGRAGRPRPDVRLSLVGEPTTDGDSGALGAWTLATAVHALGLDERVQIRRPAVDAGQAWRPLGRATIHLAPHGLANIEPAVLASCAIGIPTLVTRFGAAAEVLAGVARLVPPAVTLDVPAGHREAIMDVGHAVRHLMDLTDDPAARRVEGTRAREGARAFTPSAVMDRWHAELGALAVA
ncbi:MAG: glycosyltransferase [Vicinamibacterales bacterium]